MRNALRLRPLLGVTGVLFLPLAAACLAGGESAADRPPTMLFVDGSGPRRAPGGTCAEQTPCNRITDALVQARRLRNDGHDAPIRILIAAGIYRGTYTPIADSSPMEPLPLLINVPGVSLEGRTRLGVADARGVPTCPEAGCLGTNITTDEPLVQGQALLFIGPTAGGPPVRDVTLSQLSIFYPARSRAFTLYYDRVENLRIEGTFIAGGAIGPCGRFSTVAVIGNVVRGGAPGICVLGGTTDHPSRAVVVHNRFEHGLVGGFVAGTADTRDIIAVSPGVPLTIASIDTRASADRSSVAFVGNEMSDNTWAGMRLLPLANHTVAAAGTIDAIVVSNRFQRNARTGLSIDAGFSFRSREEPLSGHLSLYLDGNEYDGHGSWPQAISFTRLDPPDVPNDRAQWKFLEHSSYEIWL